MMRKYRKTENQGWKILLVEDGSVDIDELNQFIDENNLKIKVLVYRQSAIPPKYLTNY